MSYLFKDTELAARRLHILSQVFAPASQAFLRESVDHPPVLAIDLGCGPGYTTKMLAETTQSQQTVGLDSSTHFIALAQEQAEEKQGFVCHDITQVPFPVGPADLLYCRFLLTHLANPLSIVERWGTQLKPEGLLLVEESEQITTTNPIFQTYLDIVAAMLAWQSNELYIGPVLDSYKPARRLQQLSSRLYRLPVTTAEAAMMFYPNIQTWKSQPFIQETYESRMIEELEQALGELADHSTSSSEIEWQMRQIVYQRKKNE